MKGVAGRRLVVNARPARKRFDRSVRSKMVSFVSSRASAAPVAASPENTKNP
jgi:hypothetical protein